MFETEKVEKAVTSRKFWVIGQISSKTGEYRLMSSNFKLATWCTSINGALKIKEVDTRNSMKITKMLESLYPDEKFDQTFAMKVKLCVDDLVFAEEIDSDILKC